MPAPDVNARAVVWAGVAIAATVMLCVGAVFLLLRLWDMPADADRAGLRHPLHIPGPALESAPQLDLQQYRLEKQRLLHSSGWVDARQGIVRIPIDDAMELLAHPPRAAASGAKVRP